jgi:hypothetical protein
MTVGWDVAAGRCRTSPRLHESMKTSLGIEEEVVEIDEGFPVTY